MQKDARMESALCHSERIQTAINRTWITAFRACYKIAYNFFPWYWRLFKLANSTKQRRGKWDEEPSFRETLTGWKIGPTRCEWCLINKNVNYIWDYSNPKQQYRMGTFSSGSGDSTREQAEHVLGAWPCSKPYSWAPSVWVQPADQGKRLSQNPWYLLGHSWNIGPQFGPLVPEKQWKIREDPERAM